MENQKITITTTVNAPVEKVWQAWTNPEDVMKWNNANEDWHTPRAENDLRTGGKFNYRMESRDGKYGFDFAGDYDEVKENESIDYALGDGRKVSVRFTGNGNQTTVEETFDAEEMNSIEMQRDGWQAILNNFKKHVEST